MMMCMDIGRQGAWCMRIFFQNQAGNWQDFAQSEGGTGAGVRVRQALAVRRIY